MITTVIFDLDGTLLRFNQAAFVELYFKKLGKVFADMGMNPEQSMQAVWGGTKAMLLNDGTCLNIVRFWDYFVGAMSLTADEKEVVEKNCDEFYTKDFDNVKSVLAPNSVGEDNISKKIVHELKQKGYEIVLATNPLFPQCAVETRLSWIGLNLDDFKLVTHYANSSFCKPNLGYYKEVLSKIGKKAEQCLMVGNNPAEDMCASQLGMDVYFVNEYVEGGDGVDTSTLQQGTLDDFHTFQEGTLK